MWTFGLTASPWLFRRLGLVSAPSSRTLELQSDKETGWDAPREPIEGVNGVRSP